MASKRRGGFRPPELRGTLGTLLRTTTDVVRGALERGASAGRARLDDVRSSRRRTDALAELGELVLDLIRRGEIDLAELPEARDLVRHLDDLDASGDDEPDEPRASIRRRFDDRGEDARGAGRLGPSGGASRARRDDVWRPFAADSDERREPDDRHAPDARSARSARGPDRDARPPDERSRDDRSLDDRSTRSHVRDSDERYAPEARHPRDDRSDRQTRPGSSPRPPSSPADDDGTVSSGAALRATRPTTPARPRPETETSRAPTKPMKGPWRRPDPVLADEAPEPISASPSRPRPSLAPDPHRRGGISFDDDDLNEYMHPDDVPAKTPPRDPDAGDS